MPAEALPLATPSDPAAVDVLCSAFRDYPVMRHVIRTEGEEYNRHLQDLIRFFVTARRLRDEPILGIEKGQRLAGVALASDPFGPPSPPALAEARERCWSSLGEEARARYEAFGEACSQLLADVPRLHLNMVGITPAEHGRGLGGRLIDAAVRLADNHPAAEGVSLTTEDPDNLPLYRHLGFRETGHHRVADGLETWAMFRPTGG